MKRFETSAVIGRSADEVWAYAADILRHPEWMSVQNARVTAGDGTQVGARGVERQVFGPFKLDIAFEVAEAVPGRRITWRGDDPRFDMEYILDLEPLPDRTTRATWRAAIGLHGGWRLLTPLLGMEGAASLRRELGRLKSNLEAQPRVASPADARP
jgi:uncharacterized membrane protein